MITRLAFAGIPTSNQDRASAFWTDKVGFRIVTDRPLGDQRWIELGIAKSDTRIVLYTPEDHADRIGTFFNGSFICDDVEATWRQLTAKGVEFTVTPQKQPWGISATFIDPDGNQFVLSSS